MNALTEPVDLDNYGDEVMQVYEIAPTEWQEAA